MMRSPSFGKLMRYAASAHWLDREWVLNMVDVWLHLEGGFGRDCLWANPVLHHTVHLQSKMDNKKIST